MVLLLGVAFVAGVITAVSPCVLPVLPIVLAGGATGGTRRPFAIIAGLVVSFTTFTLAAAALLDALGLPQDLLRNVAIALLFVLAATLLVPQLGVLLERPFAFLTRRRGGELGGGFLLGVSLGLVFVPCAGPVLAAIAVVAASNHVGWRALLLTVAYAVGAAIPMLLIALGGRGIAARLRAQGAPLRAASGLVVRRVPQGRPRDRRRAHPGVRLRARRLERARCDRASRHPLPGGAGQQVPDVVGLRQRVLARRVPGRPQRRAPPRRARRGRLRP